MKFGNSFKASSNAVIISENGKVLLMIEAGLCEDLFLKAALQGLTCKPLAER